MSTNKTITLLSIVALVSIALTTAGTIVLPVKATEEVGEYEGPDHPGDTDCIQAGLGNVHHNQAC